MQKLDVIGRLIPVVIVGLLAVGCLPGERSIPVYSDAVPVAGNSWVMNDLSANSSMISRNGLVNWSDAETMVSTFFRTSGTGAIDIAMIARVVSGKSTIEVAFACEQRRVKLTNTEFDTIYIGRFDLGSPGYQTLGMRGLSKTDSVYAEVREILIGGEAIGDKAYYLKDDFYFGRRGPSVHLLYKIPEESGDVVLFYNEITVPEGNDIPGSFFMANGFSHGYFGIQVNSETERRILFSVWSPFQTDNPKEIPEEYKIIMLDKGADVITGEFGNEGSGGQSFRRYYWQAGTKYGFLLRGEPGVKGSTDYTAWFFAPEIGDWELIASFRRPKTDTYLKGIHSFLENFRTETGPITRQGYFSNQWVSNTKGEWFELDEAVFTADATARKEARLDYAGGAEGSSFFLKNCGFFNVRTAINSEFRREKTGNRPLILP